MCYFLNLEISGQKQSGEILSLLPKLAEQHALHLQGEFPSFLLTNGHCSCRLVLSGGNAIKPMAFLTELVQIAAVKHLKVGWTWATGQDLKMKPEIEEVRLPIQEFVRQNNRSELSPDVWYRLHDPEKYPWQQILMQ